MLLAISNCPFSFGNHKFIFHVYESLSDLEISSFEYFLFFLSFFLIPHVSDIVMIFVFLFLAYFTWYGIL